jgi:RHS repeat-associated protein
MLSAFVVDLDHGRSLAAMWHALRASNFGYRNGVEIDAGIVHALLQARYQDPQRGQFISQDPTFLALGNPDQLKQFSQQDQQTFLSDPQQLNSYSYARNNPISRKDPNGRSALTGGFDFSAWNFTGSAGLNFDQYGIDYYYGWGIAAGVHTGANAGITTDNLSHTYSLSSSGFAAAGDFYGGEVSYGMTQYPYTKKPSQQSMVMTGGINFGDAAGVRSVVSGPLLVWGSRPQTTFPTITEVMAQNASISAAHNASTLPTTVTVGGITYYRNYSGLLSTTAAQSTPPVTGSTINNNTPGSSGSGASLFQLHAIVPH